MEGRSEGVREGLKDGRSVRGGGGGSESEGRSERGGGGGE